MKEDIRNYSTERGHTAIYRSIFGWYIVDVFARNRIGMISSIPSKRTRHFTKKRAFAKYVNWCAFLDDILPPEHYNCRCAL